MPRYIDVDKEIREINDVILEKEYAGKADEFTAYCFRRFADALSKAPTADVQEVKHGKDIYYTVCDKHCEFKCSICNAWIGVVEGGTLDAARDFNYCPACGAKMDGKDNEK